MTDINVFTTQIETINCARYASTTRFTDFLMKLRYNNVRFF